MSKTKRPKPLLFVDTFQKGCEVEEQHFFKTPKSEPQDIQRTDYTHHFDSQKEENKKSKDRLFEKSSSVTFQESTESTHPLNETMNKQEIVTFINKVSQRSPHPFVQVTQKDGKLKIGTVELMDENTLLLNQQESFETIALGVIETINIIP